MIDLTNVTFCIPVRIDSVERLENLDIVLGFLLANFDTNIHIWEDGPTQILNNVVAKYTFVENKDPIFYRTRILNNLVKDNPTNIVAIYDADVLLPVSRYVEAVQILRNNEADVVWPYAGVFVNVPYDTKILELINTPDLIAGEIVGFDSTGGAIFWNRSKFIEIGMENEHFVSWGVEDREMLIRVLQLGFRYFRLDGMIYHLDHPRGINSGRTNPHFEANDAEYYRIYEMNPDHLRKEIETWPWTK